MEASSEAVRRFYDGNTRAFLEHGQGGGQGAIHRAVWGPGVSTREDAFHYVERLMIERLTPLAIASHQHARVLDLGCGVGASLCTLAQALPIDGLGVTLSPVQAEIAQSFIAERGLSSRVRCLEGDYCNLPAQVKPVHAAMAIEAFLHGPDPVRFFEQAAEAVLPGGLLMVCDDFLAVGVDPSRRDTKHWVDRFKRAWNANSLLPVSEVKALARSNGFEAIDEVHLTEHLELGRPRDKAIALLQRSLGWLPLTSPAWLNMVGGHALQVCLQRGVVQYWLLVFQRSR